MYTKNTNTKEQEHRYRSEVVSNLVFQVAKKLKDKRQKRTMEEIFKKVTNIFQTKWMVYCITSF